MLLLAGFGILVSGYLGFATRREGKSLVQASLLASLSAAVLQAIVGGGTAWLSGTPLPYVIAPAITAWALACAAALSGDARLDVVAIASAIDDRGVLFLDAHALGAPEHLERDVSSLMPRSSESHPN